jgi:FkbM family methyltransferase
LRTFVTCVGRLYVSPENGLRYWKFGLTSVDPNLLRNVAELVQPGMHVWDVGANCGLFTFSAAHRAGVGGSVLAIEPDVENVRLLLRSRKAMLRSQNASVDILPAAVGGPGDRVARLQIAVRSRASNALAGFGYATMGGCREERIVAVLTLDELLAFFPPPDLLKVDVEGAELLILGGARRLFSEAQPTLLIEVAPSCAEEVSCCLQSWDYRLFSADVLPTEREEKNQVQGNCLALPKKKWDLASRQVVGMAGDVL